MNRAVPVLLLAGVITTVPAQTPQLAFHHLHLNGAGLQEFYGRLFDPATTTTTPVAGYRALRSGPMLMLFGEPHAAADQTPAVAAGDTAVWHFGWGSVSLGESYLQHAAREVQWEPPLPAGQLHLHLVSASPATAAAWYRDALGARVEVLALAGDPGRTSGARPEQRVAEALVYFGEFALLIYRTDQKLVSTRGQRVDHFALAAPGARFGETKAQLVEGPDHILIELIGASPRAPGRD
jgi:hypothetical protein